jgi:hypothetical protein
MSHPRRRHGGETIPLCQVSSDTWEVSIRGNGGALGDPGADVGRNDAFRMHIKATKVAIERGYFENARQP